MIVIVCVYAIFIFGFANDYLLVSVESQQMKGRVPDDVVYEIARHLPSQYLYEWRLVSHPIRKMLRSLYNAKKKIESALGIFEPDVQAAIRDGVDRGWVLFVRKCERAECATSIQSIVELGMFEVVDDVDELQLVETDLGLQTLGCVLDDYVRSHFITTDGYMYDIRIR